MKVLMKIYATLAILIQYEHSMECNSFAESISLICPLQIFLFICRFSNRSTAEIHLHLQGVIQIGSICLVLLEKQPVVSLTSAVGNAACLFLLFPEEGIFFQASYQQLTD